MKRERWTEMDIDALPLGEHDYFERKSGRTFENTGDWLGKLGKALSAMANSGGGHIILGVDDNGVPDGVPLAQGRTPTRDWLEQKIPNLLQYPLSDFRVHVVEASDVTRIPTQRAVVVIDVGDSALAPHQCAVSADGVQRHTYYHRQAGRSVPAPHFYLELLRQRLVNPSLEATATGISLRRAAVTDEGYYFVALRVRFILENVGKVAAYKWRLALVDAIQMDQSRRSDYRFRTSEYPAGGRVESGIPIGDDTILPGDRFETFWDFGIQLRITARLERAIFSDLETSLSPLVMQFRVATEVSRGEVFSVPIGPLADVYALTQEVAAALGARAS